MNISCDSISSYPDTFDEGIFIEKENSAIDDFNFEEASRIYNEFLESKKQNVIKQEDHYNQERESYEEENSREMAYEIEQLEINYENRVIFINKDFDAKISDLSDTQRDNLQNIEAEWKEAREFARTRVMVRVESMLRTSQELARSHVYDRAISLRDQARALENEPNSEEIIHCNAQFEGRMRTVLERHKTELKKLQTLRSNALKSAKNQHDLDLASIEAKHRIIGADSSRLIMDSIISSQGVNESTKEVIRSFSPRSRKYESSNQSSPRSPGRLSNRDLDE